MVEADVLCLQFIEHLKAITLLFSGPPLFLISQVTFWWEAIYHLCYCPPWMSYYFGLASYSFFYFLVLSSSTIICLGVVFFAFILFQIYITHIFFICLSISGHLGCFYIFSSVQSLSRVWLCDPMNRSTPGLPVHHQLLEFTQTHANIFKGAVNVGGCIYLFKLVFLFSLHKYPELEYLDHMVVLNFLRSSILFFIVLVLIYIPTNSVGKIPLLHNLFRNTCYSLLFW